jgi:hypothetical protein
MYNEGVYNFTSELSPQQKASSIHSLLTRSEQFVVSGVATVVEIYVAVISACLPSLTPVYRKWRFGDPLKSDSGAPAGASAGNSGLITIGKKPTRKLWNSSTATTGSFERLGNSEEGFTPAASHRTHQVNVITSRNNDIHPDDNTESYPLQGVVVKRETVWSENNDSGTARPR